MVHVQHNHVLTVLNTLLKNKYKSDKTYIWISGVTNALRGLSPKTYLITNLWPSSIKLLLYIIVDLYHDHYLVSFSNTIVKSAWF